MFGLIQHLRTVWTPKAKPPVPEATPIERTGVDTSAQHEQTRYSTKKQEEAHTYGKNGQREQGSAPNIDEHV